MPKGSRSGVHTDQCEVTSSRLKQNENNRDLVATHRLRCVGTIAFMFNPLFTRRNAMKPWIRRSLIGLTTATVLLGGLSACGRSHHTGGLSDERITEMRGKAIERISGKLDLNTAQQAKLGVLADQMIASRKALRGNTDPRTDLQALVAGSQFDRAKAQQLLDQKLSAAQGNGPQVLAAFGDFYDSLTPEQQKQVRERLEKRRSWWSRG